MSLARSLAGPRTNAVGAMQLVLNRVSNIPGNLLELFFPPPLILFTILVFQSFLFYSLTVLNPSVGHTMDVLSPFISILCLTSTESPVHDLMLSIQAVRGLPRLRAPGIVPCIISFSRQFPCFLMV